MTLHTTTRRRLTLLTYTTRSPLVLVLVPLAHRKEPRAFAWPVASAQCTVQRAQQTLTTVPSIGAEAQTMIPKPCTKGHIHTPHDAMVTMQNPSRMARSATPNTTITNTPIQTNHSRMHTRTHTPVNKSARLPEKSLPMRSENTKTTHTGGNRDPHRKTSRVHAPHSRSANRVNPTHTGVLKGGKRGLTR